MSPVQAMERSYVTLKQMLREGHFAPGTRLEANRLAGDLGVSMTPVRDVLHRLAGERLVEASSGDGFHVAHFTEAALRDLYEWNSALTLRLQSLHAILSEHACRRVACTGADTAPALGQAAAFAGSRSLAPFARNCLLDSLALDRWLTARGLAAMLVFGVKLDPFEAHCWLQVRNAILNDSYDHVSRFTPILAV